MSRRLIDQETRDTLAQWAMLIGGTIAWRARNLRERAAAARAKEVSGHISEGYGDVLEEEACEVERGFALLNSIVGCAQ